MEYTYRNAEYNENGSIDCEIEHPKYGWIPFTAIDGDADSQETFDKIVSDGAAAAYVENLVAVKAKEVARINEERDDKLNTLTVDLDGATYDADPEARANITATVAALNSGGVPVPDPITWRDHNNVTQSLTHAKLVELAAIVFLAVETIYNDSWTMKSQVEAAADSTVARAVTWP